MTSPRRELGRHDGLCVHEYRCTARRGDAPFAERHSRSGFALVRSGNFVYRRGRMAHALVPGSILLANAGDEYVCSHEYGGGDVCVSFAFEPEAIGEVRFERPTLPPSPRIAALVRRALAAIEGRSDVGMDEIAYALLTELTRPTAGAPRGAAADRERAVHAAEYMEAHSAEPLDLATLARHVGLSPYHFLRLFRRELGVTPHQHLIRVRVRKAVDRLLDTKSPITDIALEVGFEDLSNFVRTFRRSVGAPPGEFRRKILQVRARSDA